MAGFKKFLMQGNLIELAVAFVIGSAFAALVSGFVSAIVKPVLAAFMGSSTKPGLGFNLNGNNPATFIDIGALINYVIVFVLTAAIVYLLFVLPYKKYQAMKGKDAFADGPTEVDLLTEIDRKSVV